MEIPAKKFLIYKLTQLECTSQEIEEAQGLIRADVEDKVLHEILDEAWEELPLAATLDEKLSEEIFQNICHTTGITNTANPVAAKKEIGAPSKWLFVVATIALLLVMVVPRK